MLLEIFQEVSRSWLVHLCSLPGAEMGQGNLDGMVLLASFQERKEVLGKFGHLLRESGLVAGTNSIGQYGDCSSAWQPGALALLHFLCFFSKNSGAPAKGHPACDSEDSVGLLSRAAEH